MSRGTASPDEPESTRADRRRLPRLPGLAALPGASLIGKLPGASLVPGLADCAGRGETTDTAGRGDTAENTGADRGPESDHARDIRARLAPAQPEWLEFNPEQVPRPLRPHLPRTLVRRAEDDLDFYPLMTTGLLAGVGALAVQAASQVPDLLPWRSYDPYAGEKMRYLGADRGGIITAADGTPLSVRAVGPADAALTIVFVHGFTLTKETFHFQATRLRARYGQEIRMIFYDQRGHGASGTAPKRTYTIDQLADDLEVVINASAPTGPLILVGHSMGGMTVLNYCQRYTETVTDRVLGVGLLASAASKLPDAGLPALLDNPAITGLTWVVDKAPGVFRGGRRALAAIIEPLIKAGSFGDPTVVGDTITDFTNATIGATDVEVMAAFVESLVGLDATGAFPVLQDLSVLVVCGDADLLTPVNRSVEIARALPNARFVVVPGAGHMIQFEAIDVVNEELSWLIDAGFAQAGITRSVEAADW